MQANPEANLKKLVTQLRGAGFALDVEHLTADAVQGAPVEKPLGYLAWLAWTRSKREPEAWSLQQPALSLGKPDQLTAREVATAINALCGQEIITERAVRGWHTKSGGRVGEGTRFHVMLTLGWLIEDRHGRESEADAYEKVKERARQRSAALALAGRDIGELPAVGDPARKERAANCFRTFCDSYFGDVFHLAWSEDHLKVIAKIEQAVLRGGLFALAMPRGSGKTSLSECACIWAVANGHRNFVCLIGCDETHGSEMIESIKTECDSNDLLLEDYPEVCYPIRALDGIANRAAGQLYHGERTHIGWTQHEVVFPTIAGSLASAAIIKVAGITGRIRGMKFKRPDGKSARPDLVVLDDPQTDESARSVSQCATREHILAGAVLGLAGPGKKISGIMPCTVIRPGDMADNILDREKHPEWAGERTKMLYSMPSDEKLLARYAEVRAASLIKNDDLSDASAWWRANQEKIEEGAVAAWPERYNIDEVSAIQHAINLRLQDERAFQAEYQNDPLPLDAAEEDELTADDVARKLNGLARRLVSIDCDHVTAYIDVQKKILYWVVAAWGEGFEGQVLDYGTWPNQGRDYFTLRDAQRTLSLRYGTSAKDAAIYAGLTDLVSNLTSGVWTREDAAPLRTEQILIDAGWETKTIHKFCRQCGYAIVKPSQGIPVTASNQPFSEYRKKAGDQIGHYWRVPRMRGAVRQVSIDVNYWKSFVHERLATPMGAQGCLALWGDDEKVHRLFSEHITSEYYVRTSGRGRTVDEWKLRPECTDNHWFDCLVGCAVAASMLGVSRIGHDEQPKQKTKPTKLSELRKRKRDR